MNSNTNQMPTQTKKVSNKKVHVTKEVVETLPVVEVPQVTPETEVETLPTLSVDTQIKNLMSFVDEQMKQLKTVKLEMKNLLSSYQKELKDSKTKKKRVKKENHEYVPHGFTKPVHISPELASFLNVAADATIARPSVTRAISLYVKEHTLYDESNKSIFKADKTLKKLLGEPQFLVEPKKPELGLGYCYKNLQKYLTPHFMKA